MTWRSTFAAGLILVVFNWALSDFLFHDAPRGHDVTGLPLWFAALMKLSCFFGVAVYIWRGRAAP